MQQRILTRFETHLQTELLRLCTSYGVLDGKLPASADINNFWTTLAPEYMADAVPQVQQYPTVSVAWAAYLGMAVAHGWDKHWEQCSVTPYRDYYGPNGFDDMDEHIVQSVLALSLDSREAKDIETIIRRMAQATINLIRHEQIEPQSPMAFHVFARAVKVMYRMGAALELKRLGYKMERMELL